MNRSFLALTVPRSLATRACDNLMHWLLKAEPESRIVKGQDVKYTIDDLKSEKVGTWDGVRNNEARNHLASMREGETAFFYRSNCKEPAIVGTMKIVKEAYPDETAKNPKAPYYDPKNPDRWVVVDVEYVSHLPQPVLLLSIKNTPQLKDMQLVKRSRLSVTPVTDKEWDIVMKMSHTSDTMARKRKSSQTETKELNRKSKRQLRSNK